MSDTPGGLPDEPAEVPAGPQRVIGTPSPAQARTLLRDGAGDGDGAQPAPRELPADPPTLKQARTAERKVGPVGAPHGRGGDLGPAAQRLDVRADLADLQRV